MSRHGLQHGGTTAAIGGGHLDRVRRCTRTMSTDMSAMCWAILLWKKNLLLPTTGLGRGSHTFPWRVPSPVANFAETEPSGMLFTVCIMCRPHEHGVQVGTTSDRGVDRTDHNGDTRAHGAPHALHHNIRHMSPTLSADMAGGLAAHALLGYPPPPIELCASSPQGHHDAHHQQAFHTSHTMRRQRFAVLPRHPTKTPALPIAQPLSVAALPTPASRPCHIPPPPFSHRSRHTQIPCLRY